MPKVINSVSHHYLQLSQWPLKHKAKNWLEQNGIYQEVIAKLVAADAVIVSQFCDKVIILRSIPHHCFTPLPIIRPRKVKRKKKSNPVITDKDLWASGRPQRAIGTRSGQSPLALQVPVRTWRPSRAKSSCGQCSGAPSTKAPRTTRLALTWGKASSTLPWKQGAASCRDSFPTWP